MPPRIPTQAVCVTLAALLALAGCGPKADEYAPACPVLRMLGDGADLVRFNGRGQDITDLTLQARISGVQAACAAGARGIVRATIKPVFDVLRGPALAGREAQMRYFVAVVEGDTVRDEQDFAANVAFAPNADRVQASGEEITMHLPVTTEKNAARFTIYVSFRLTPQELAYNRRTRTN